MCEKNALSMSAIKNKEFSAENDFAIVGEVSMKPHRPSVDGFIPRRRTQELGAQHASNAHSDKKPETTPTELHSGNRQERDIARERPSETTVGRSDITESLKTIDDEAPELSRKERRAQRKRDRKGRPVSRRRRIIKWSLIALAAVIVVIGGFLAVRALTNLGKVFNGNLFDLVQRQPLKQDANGRSNFVIFGTAEDDEGGEHGGANLTDSIMILSVNQEQKDAYMLSIPRDLWVNYGQACNSGYQGKINEVYNCYSNDGADEKAGAAALQAKVGEITGLEVQYYVHLNFTAVVEAVDAVGGVDVTIESNPKGDGILDRNFDWKCNYTCYYVNYEDGEVAHLDGEHALALARARNAQGGYGLQDSNFDREKNQQKIIKALREKALSAGTLTNLGKVTGLIDALGNNLRTNIDTKEIQTAMTLASEINSDAIVQLTLVDKEEPLVTTGPIGGASAVYPVAGTFSYGAIKAYVAKHTSSNPVTKEAAKVVVLNGTRQSGVAQTEADKLEAKGYTIGAVDNAPEGTYGAVEIFQVGETGASKTATAAALKEYYGVTTIKTTTPPVAVAADTAFVVVIGKVRS